MAVGGHKTGLGRTQRRHPGYALPDRFECEFVKRAEVQTAQGKLYLLVAIDRTSKFAFVEALMTLRRP